MRFLPIVERELREASRRRGTYWLRTFVAAVIIAASVCLFLFNLNERPREVAQIIFHTLGGGALLYCLIAGMHGTADSISEEKREGTLGLLFLTDLKGYDVVLGKLVASSLNGFYGLLAILPVICVPLLMGGLTGMQLAHAAVALVNTMFFSLCLGIFASAICRSHRKAVALTLLLMLAFTGGFPLLGAWLSWKNHWSEFHQAFLLPSPVYSYIAGQIPVLPKITTLEYFYVSQTVVHGIGWLFLALACAIAPRSWQDKPAGATRLKWRERIRLWGLGDATRRREFRARLLDQNPFFWLAARDRLKPAQVWMFLGSAAGLWFWGAVEFKNDWMEEAIFVLTAFLLNSVLKNWFASEVVRQLSDDRKMGSLELLLSTPLTVREILRGQALALRRQFLWPVVAVLAAETVMCLAAAEFYHDSTYASFRIFLWLASMVMLVADVYALYWVGMWMGLAAKNPKRAFTGTVGRVLALPTVAWVILMTMGGLMAVFHGPEFSPGFILGAWLVIGLIADFGFTVWARQNLLTRFRVVATQRFQAQPSRWTRLFGSGTHSQRKFP